MGSKNAFKVFEFAALISAQSTKILVIEASLSAQSTKILEIAAFLIKCTEHKKSWKLRHF